LAQPVTTVTLAWNLEGVQLLVLLWQVVQPAVVGMWLAPLPLAAPPLTWQLAQLVALLKPLWSTLAPDQLLVDLWQLSQLAVVGKWLADLPLARLSLWQVVQPVLTETLAWNFAGVQVEYPAL